MTLAAVSPTTNGATGSNTQDLTLEEWLERLRKHWVRYQKKGLEVRWEMGKELNKRLVSPTKRQAHGQETLKKVGKELGISQSDISRMRTFAIMFPSFQEFEEKHPEMNSWSQIKGLISNLNAIGKGKEPKRSEPCGNGEPSGAPQRTEEKDSATCDPPGSDEHDDPVVSGIFRSLKDATEKFRQNGFALEGARRAQMLKAIEQLVEVVSERLQIRLNIELQGA